MSDRDAESFLSMVDHVYQRDPQLTRLGAAMVMAAALGIASDTKRFARIFGVEHALVIRQLEALVVGGTVAVAATDLRTLKSRYTLNASAHSLHQIDC